MLRQKFIIAACFTILPFSGSAEEGEGKTRQYRPLEAKQVAIRTAARVDSAVQDSNSASMLRKKAWQHFDLREWDEAFEAFLDAIEKDPNSVPAAEGLAMSLYHSGDYASAFRLGQELKGAMPTVGRIVTETVLADVRYMIKQGEYDSANEFLSNFPTEDAKIEMARQMVADADTITTALGPDGDSVSIPASPGKLVRN